MGTFRPASALTFDDILLVPRLSSVHPRSVDVRSRFTRGIALNIRLVSAPVGTTLDEAERILSKHRVEKLPVVDEHGVLKGLITIKDIFKRRRHPHANKDQHGRLRVAAAVGGTTDALARARALLDAGCDVIVVDSAHGHSEGVLKTVACLREAFPDAQLVGGNVATEPGTRPPVEHGGDAVKR